MRAPPNRKRALKLSAGDRAVARDCLKSGFGLGQATLHVEAHRLKKLKKEVEEGLREKGMARIESGSAGGCARIMGGCGGASTCVGEAPP